MGGRLSKPTGPGGMTEASTSVGPAATPRRPGPFTARTVIAPLGIIAVGCLFYVYSRITITAAKENARRSREADGGSISWRNENARRHGLLAKPQERTLWDELRGKKEEKEGEEDKAQAAQSRQKLRGDDNPIEQGIKRARERSAAARRGALEDKDDP